jgi:hypothetical protein
MKAAFRLLAPLCVLASCQSVPPPTASNLFGGARQAPAAAFRRSISFPKRQMFPHVLIGSSFEGFKIRVPDGVRRIEIPEDAYWRVGSGDEVDGIIKKNLGWAGHPADETGGMSIYEEREALGVAAGVRGRTLQIASFGEWHSFEGGCFNQFVLIVPPGIEIVMRPSPDNYTAKRMADEGWLIVPTQPSSQKAFANIAGVKAAQPPFADDE